MTQPHHRNRHPKYRKKYKVHNWRAYEQSLINRGDLTLWLSEDVIQSWNIDLDHRLGRPKSYSDLAIEMALTLRLLFKGPLRQTEGFLKSIFRLINVGLNVPDHTTLLLCTNIEILDKKKLCEIFKYITQSSVKESLVDHPKEWTGLHAYLA